MKCECCKKRLKNVFGGTKYCIPCSVNVSKKNKIINTLKHRNKKLEELGSKRILNSFIKWSVNHGFFSEGLDPDKVIDSYYNYIIKRGTE